MNSNKYTQLAIGSFDPLLKDSYFKSWPDFIAVEIELFHYFSWTPQVIRSFRSWIKKNKVRIIPRIGIRLRRSSEEYQEAIRIWLETFQDETLYFLVHSGRRQWSADGSLEEIEKLPRKYLYFFEWGRDDSIASVRFLLSRPILCGWVLDPHWHFASVSDLSSSLLHFKLHGWNRERWVRRYGENQIVQILRTVRKREDGVLTLSYSGKIEQALLFCSRWEGPVD